MSAELARRTVALAEQSARVLVVKPEQCTRNIGGYLRGRGVKLCPCGMYFRCDVCPECFPEQAPAWYRSPFGARQSGTSSPSRAAVDGTPAVPAREAHTPASPACSGEGDAGLAGPTDRPLPGAPDYGPVAPGSGRSTEGGRS